VEVVLVPGVRLVFEERTEISRRLRLCQSFRMIGLALGRPTSTISREVARNGGRDHYRPLRADQQARRRARRPKPFRLECHRWLAHWVAQRLAERWSPEQIAGRLKFEHPGDPRWWVSPETIYQSLYVQGRGGLADELTAYLRTRRAKRRTPGHGQGRGQLNDMVNIAERPPEVDERRVPGHWEGDLLLGGRYSQIGTLVERVSRLFVPVHLPDGRTAPVVADAIAAVIQQLPRHVVRTLTWDQGKEMAGHVGFTVATGVQVYFCDPASPWQRGTNENTNRLLRDYFPKGQTDFRDIGAAELWRVADELNNRPRKVLGFRTPAEVYAELVAMTG
jgi:IS30 family transposase